MNRLPGLGRGLPALLILSACSGSLRQVVIAPQQVQGLHCIAVLPFDNSTSTYRAGDILADTVSSELLLGSAFTVLEPGEAARLLDAQGLPHSAASLDPLEAQRLGEVLGVDGVLFGAVAAYRGRTTIPAGAVDQTMVAYTARLLEVKSGEVLWSASATATDDNLLLAIPKSVQALAHAAVRASLAGLLTLQPASSLERPPCWRSLPAVVEVAPGGFATSDRYLTVRAQPGDTLTQVADRFLINPGQVDLIATSNPGMTTGQPLAASAVLRLPRYLEHTVAGTETLASIAETLLGHRAYSVLLYEANRSLFPETDEASGPDAVIDSTEVWSQFDVAGSIDDMHVVVNGVAATFPNASVQLRWLVSGKRLQLKAGRPAEESFFEVKIESPGAVRDWRIEIRDAAGKTARTLSGNGPPATHVDWDGLLDRGRALNPGSRYTYQLTLTNLDGTTISSALEDFGAGVRVGETPRGEAKALIRNQPIAIHNGHFSHRVSTETFVGILPLELRDSSGRAGIANFAIPSLSIERPRKLEVLRAGVTNEVYAFPAVPLIDGHLDQSALDSAEITFVLIARTEAGNQAFVNGTRSEVDGDGFFRAKVTLRRGRNVLTVVVRTPLGSQTVVEKRLTLQTRGLERRAWEFAASGAAARPRVAFEPLPAGTIIKVPLLKMAPGDSTASSDSVVP